MSQGKMRLLDIASRIWAVIAPFTKVREMPVTTIALFGGSLLILAVASVFMAGDWLFWVFSWIYWIATALLLLAGVGLYSYGFSEGDPKWTGRGLMCLNGPLILSALAGILVIVGVATNSLTQDTLDRLYRDEAVIVGVYCALIAIHLVIDVRQRSKRLKEKNDLSSADRSQASA